VDEIPDTPLMNLARHHHELFMCYVEVGFTENQALKLLAYWSAGTNDTSE
jgi:hypothetical protein